MFEKEKIPIIAETACGHEGSVDRLEDLINAVGSTQADGIKFHAFLTDNRAVPGSNYHSIVKNLEIPLDSWEYIFDRAREYDLEIFVDVFDTTSAEIILNLNPDCIKIHAADVANYPLLDEVLEGDCPIIIYVGGSADSDISNAINYLKQAGKTDIGLMYGLQNFPTSYDCSNIGKINALKSTHEVPVGYASHVSGESYHATELPALAVAAGADIIECHFTNDRSQKHIDHISALEPKEFDQMIRHVRETEVAVGDRTTSLTDAEKKYRNDVKKMVYTTTAIEAGETITENKVTYLKGDKGFGSNNPELTQVVGKSVKQDMSKYEPVLFDDLND